MNVSPEQSKFRQPSLIEDIMPPHAERYTDVNKEEVRRRPIGSLYQQYLRDKWSKINAVRKRKALEKQKKLVQPSVQTIEPVKPAIRHRYNFVRPLQTLPSVGPRAATGLNADGAKNWAHTQIGRLYEVLEIAWLAVSGWIYALALKVFPKRYTANSGLVVDWQAKSLARLKIFVPIILLAFLLAILAWDRSLVKTPHKNTPNTQIRATATASAAPVPSSKHRGNSPSSGTSAPVSTMPQASVSQISNSPSSPAMQSSVPPVGGMGGGATNIQVPNPAPMPSPVNSLPPTTTVVVPPASIQVGDKPILDVSGTNFTVN